MTNVLHREQDRLPDHRMASSSESLRIRHLLGQYIVLFSVNFQCRMKLERFLTVGLHRQVDWIVRIETG